MDKKINLTADNGEFGISVTRKALAKALKLIADLLEKDQVPQDDWFAIDDDVDLNIWSDDGAMTAQLYKVAGGETDTSDYVTIFSMPYVEEQ